MIRSIDAAGLARAVLVEDRVTQELFYWRSLKHVRQVTTWDTLAKENPIHAAISATDEDAERIKGAAWIEMLRTQAEDGIILDVGCGYGRIAKYLLPQRQMRGYIGVDSSIEMLTRFQERYAQRPEEQMTPLLLVQSDIDDLPLRDRCVSNAFVSAVFLHNHKQTTIRSIESIARVLTPGGKLFVMSSFPNGVSLTGFFGYLYQLYLTMVGRGHQNGPVRYFSANEVRSMLAAFSHVEISRVGFEVIPKSFFFLPNSVSQRYMRWVSRPINGWLAAHCSDQCKAFFCTHYDVVATK